MTLVIENASIRHLVDLHRIEQECFQDEAFTKEQIAQLLEDYNTIGLVARVEDRIVGFIISAVYIDRNSVQGHILTIDVSLDHRRKGIGELLIRETEKILKQKGVKTSHLEVREDNCAAISLYRKLEYQMVGRLKNYYGKANGLYLRKKLT